MLYGKRLLKLMLFGSQARGDEEPGSDIDVLVILEGEVNPWKEITRTGRVTAAISLKYDVVVSCVYMPEDRFISEQSPLLLNVRKEGIAL